MNFAASEEQQAILESVERLLEQHAGPARAIALNSSGDYDFALHTQLQESGFSHIARDMAGDNKLAGLEAALVVEAITRAGGVIAAASQILVAPALDTDPMAGPVALCTADDLTKNLPIRFAAHARTLLILDNNKVRRSDLNEGLFEPVRTSFGYPMGKLVDPAQGDAILQSASTLDEVNGSTCENWWRLSLAVEAVGTMEGALQHTVAYLKERRQFGRTIGSFQAIQHRLSLCAIDLEASRWLAREAAFHGANGEAVAAAAAFALQAADKVFSETHQMSGATGFTCEFDLHIWSMRLLALRQELQGVGGARRALVESRWGDAG